MRILVIFCVSLFLNSKLLSQEVFSGIDSVIVIREYGIFAIKPTKIPDTISVKKDSATFFFYVKSFRGDMSMVALTQSNKIYAQGQYQGSDDILFGYDIRTDVIFNKIIVRKYHYFEAIPFGEWYFPDQSKFDSPFSTNLTIEYKNE